jgi:ABC-2 type transport system permease protein/capsular polysaccharide transport system permease protein
MPFHSGIARFQQSWIIQKRVLGALFLRESLTRFGRHNIGFLWLFVEPMMFTLGVTALWTAAGLGHGSNLPITAFALTGYSSVLLWRNMPGRCVGAVEPNASLLYHRNVRLLDVLVARVLLEGAGASLSFVFLTIFFRWIGWIDLPEDVLLVTAGYLMLAWFGISLGILVGALAERADLIEKLWHPITYLMFPLSGAGFVVSSLPENFQSFVLWFPMVHGVEMVRAGFFGSKVDAIYSFQYMFIVNVMLTVLGLIQVRYIASRVTPQ